MRPRDPQTLETASALGCPPELGGKTSSPWVTDHREPKQVLTQKTRHDCVHLTVLEEKSSQAYWAGNRELKWLLAWQWTTSPLRQQCHEYHGEASHSWADWRLTLQNGPLPDTIINHEPLASQSWPKENLLPFILLTWLSVKLTPNGFHYIHRLVHLWSSKKLLYMCSRWWLTQI